MMKTVCENCDNVCIASDNTPSWRWTCLKHPRVHDGFVSDSKRMTEPYLYCKDVNGGMCPLYKERKTQ